MSEIVKEMCSCGNPQSHPIPHEHDQTERETAIIKHFRNSHKALMETLERIVIHSDDPDMAEIAKATLAKAKE